MKTFPFAALLGAALSVVVAHSHAALPAFDSQNQPLPTLAPMLERTVPAVVNIFTLTRVPQQQNPLFSDPFFRRFFDLPEKPKERHTRSLGSGVVVDARNGYVITNNHVIDRAVEIAVNLHDGRTLKAELVGTDPETDVAVLKVQDPTGLAEVPISDSDHLRVGDFVVAIGNPFGLGQTVTSGIVSALSRSGLGIEGYEDFIQTDASINPGNSGGALVNLRGELVGINTAILSKSGGNVGIGFAIPINMARDIMAQLVEYGEVRRGSLGVQAQDITPDLTEAFALKPGTGGAVITRITENSSAARAGLKPGDVITHVNQRPMQDAADVRNAIGLLRVGQKVVLTVVRDGAARVIPIVLEAPEVATIEGEKIHPHLSGTVLANIVQNGSQAIKEGVLIEKMVRGSAAWNAGMRPGDIIAQANRKKITNINELNEALADASTLLLNIQRGQQALFLLIR